MRSVQRLKPLGIYVQFFGDFVLGQYLHSVSREQPLRIGEVSCRTHIPGNLVSSGVAFARCLNLRDGNLIQISGGGRECRQTQVVLHRLKRDLITETSPWPALKLTKKRLRQRPRTWRSKRSLCAVKALNSRSGRVMELHSSPWRDRFRLMESPLVRVIDMHAAAVSPNQVKLGTHRAALRMWIPDDDGYMYGLPCSVLLSN